MAQRGKSNSTKEWVRTLDELTDAMADGGPLLAAGVAWRLSGVSRQRFYRLIAKGALHGVWVMGELHVWVREVRERWQV